MKTAGTVLLALFLGSMTLLAQSSGRDSTQPAAAHVAAVSANCPITMQAQRQMRQGTLAFTGEGQKVAQKLHLTFSNPKFAEITGVQITIRGLNSTVRISPAQTAQADSSEIKKTIDLKLKVGAKGDVSADLLLPGFTSISLIDLDSVAYADGSTWRSSASKTCHAVPDGLMLISSR